MHDNERVLVYNHMGIHSQHTSVDPGDTRHSNFESPHPHWARKEVGSLPSIESLLFRAHSSHGMQIDHFNDELVYISMDEYG